MAKKFEHLIANPHLTFVFLILCLAYLGFGIRKKNNEIIVPSLIFTAGAVVVLGMGLYRLAQEPTELADVSASSVQSEAESTSNGSGKLKVADEASSREVADDVPGTCSDMRRIVAIHSCQAFNRALLDPSKADLAVSSSAFARAKYESVCGPDPRIGEQFKSLSGAVMRELTGNGDRRHLYSIEDVNEMCRREAEGQSF